MDFGTVLDPDASLQQEQASLACEIQDVEPREQTLAAGGISTEVREDASLRVTVAGPMTIYEAPEIKRRLLDSLENAQRVEVDLAQVDELDTAGFQLLFLAKREAGRAGKNLWLCATSDAVLEVLQRYCLTTSLEPLSEIAAAPAQ